MKTSKKSTIYATYPSSQRSSARPFHQTLFRWTQETYSRTLTKVWTEDCQDFSPRSTVDPNHQTDGPSLDGPTPGCLHLEESMSDKAVYSLRDVLRQKRAFRS